MDVFVRKHFKISKMSLDSVFQIGKLSRDPIKLALLKCNTTLY